VSTARQRRDSPWQLRYDLASAWALLWVASAGRRGDWKSEVHFFLADRYGRLARYYSKRGNARKARRFADKAAWHYQAGGPEPPQAAAMALPVPEAPRRVEAVGSDLEECEGPEDVA
jgi:hypothetical protein